MSDPKPIPLEHNLQLLEAIDQNPQITQADLAARLGVAVGTVNWYLRRLIAKGYIRIRHMQRRRLLYLITPRGITEKSRLGVLYMRASLQVYRQTRTQVIDYVKRIRQAGFRQVIIEGRGDLEEICRLTCLEHGIKAVSPPGNGALPILRTNGARIALILPKELA